MDEIEQNIKNHVTYIQKEIDQFEIELINKIEDKVMRKYKIPLKPLKILTNLAFQH